MKLFRRKKRPAVPGFPCPCCGYLTLPVPQDKCPGYICEVCFWEIDVFTDDHAPSDCNHGLTLAEGRRNYLAFSACEKKLVKHVRPPLKEEYPCQN